MKGTVKLIVLFSLATIFTLLLITYTSGFPLEYSMKSITKMINETFVAKPVSRQPVTTKAPIPVPNSKPFNFSTDVFFATDLVENPLEANKLSVLLTTRQEVIDEAQRLHLHIFKSILGKYKYAMLFNYPVMENKGDSAITFGEILLLRRLNIEVVFSCPRRCSKHELSVAYRISIRYTTENLVILFNGGGNVIGMGPADVRRSVLIEQYKNHQIVMFPQSIFYKEPMSHIEFCKKLYASHDHLTFVWRDKNSYGLAKKLFPKVHSLLSPDIAYQIGHVPRFMPPTHDILWIKRSDPESPVYKTPPIPPGLRVHVADWLTWKTPWGTSPMETAILMATNGLTFLQRGRVVITDRLHGHILCTLLGIPHVYIDNSWRKISNYHNTWTASVENIVLANSSADALIQARNLLEKLDKDLPPVLAYSDTN